MTLEKIIKTGKGIVSLPFKLLEAVYLAPTAFRRDEEKNEEHIQRSYDGKKIISVCPSLYDEEESFHREAVENGRLLSLTLLGSAVAGVANAVIPNFYFPEISTGEYLGFIAAGILVSMGSGIMEFKRLERERKLRLQGYMDLRGLMKQILRNRNYQLPKGFRDVDSDDVWE